ncbi:hypothetical protein VD0002_g1456 [Verticillium dahliae]|uniref:Peflin n=2 Tax=Verticillium dahliae TaxID=27337 RepID=G2WZ06_VERDV|nr:peflin [Verticillium dahliae VdLs.17]KAF3344795.1 hypothetical protein VdG2_06981 [Verticillium dahliae VDG2]KAH6703641.1 peflin [Verticillium dahliae]EGY21808.1 peflin [Verticillium dahliae VdLs.17]PNH28864.1 hypothetical protein BJF96_g7817 [Verticillium dahliae]PNH68609.1 hypothetical protein VD0002_g1456 [Verticillium dahliae]
MAYNRPYNPDELPRFAEPEHKGGAPPRPSPTTASHPHPQRHDSGASSHYPSRYDSKPQPAPPRPSDDPRREDPRREDPRREDPRRVDSHRQPSGSSAAPSHGFGATSPPPTNQPRPIHHARPEASSRPPPSPQPDMTADGADPTLLPLFRAVDKDGTGQLSERELSAALVNGDWSPFDPHTIRMMIRMFDSDRSGTIGFAEFCGLWSFLASWRTLFDRFDADRSGNISLDEFNNALVAFRYRLSPGFVELLFRTYDKRGEGVMSFDLFVQACISLKRMTDVFKKYDDDRDGYITLSFEDFLSEILKQLK